MSSEPPVYPGLYLPRTKFQHRYRTHVILFVMTLLTATAAGTSMTLDPNQSRGLTLSLLLGGLWYSIPLLVILGAHEFGHYFYCRKHDVDATLPYFLPFVPILTGTLGAVIRIREAFPSKKALFDIGVAGPIAGFVALIPFLYLGISMSQVAAIPPDAGAIYFGDPMLLKFFSWLHFGPLPEGQDIVLHPMGFAAWWGMLATALNLMPFGQLDGGHIAYAVFGRRASLISLATLSVVILLTFRSTSWISVTVMMVVMAFFLGVRHPRIVDEHEPLDQTRLLIAAIALAIFVVCFTPVPIQTFLPGK